MRSATAVLKTSKQSLEMRKPSGLSVLASWRLLILIITDSFSSDEKCSRVSTSRPTNNHHNHYTSPGAIGSQYPGRDGVVREAWKGPIDNNCICYMRSDVLLITDLATCKGTVPQAEATTHRSCHSVGNSISRGPGYLIRSRGEPWRKFIGWPSRLMWRSRSFDSEAKRHFVGVFPWWTSRDCINTEGREASKMVT